jgi:hypothetical protein
MLTDDFCSFEDDIIRNNFFIKEHNLLIWPLVRWQILSYIQMINDHASTDYVKHPMFAVRNFKYIHDTLLYAPHKLKTKYNIIFYVPSRGRLNNNFNIYSDYYSSLLNKTLVIDTAFRGSYVIPDKIDNYATGDYGRVASFLLCQIKRIFSVKENPDIEFFIDFLRKKITFEDNFFENIRKKIYEFYLSHKCYKYYLTDVFKKLDPKVVFADGGAYGGYSAILLKTAKEKEILTGEFQHGIISRNHFAYNYRDEVIKNDEYRKYLPDYILTYGDYWNKQIKIPCKVMTIGAPHFYESINKFRNVKEKKKTILIVSQATITGIFVKIAEYLAVTLPHYRIIFKLHPGEVAFEERYQTLYHYNNVQVAKSGDIYKFITECENLVAHTSTTIFEAIGFNKKIFVLDDDVSKVYIPKDIGIKFKNKEDLKELIIQSEKQNLSYDLDYYFNSNWKENYIQFLEENAVIK